MNARYVRPVDERSSSNLAATKLRPPVPPARLVDRARLGAVLDEADAADVPLVLVSAPAGSGKSTLVAGWAAAAPASVAWLQLEESDADPARFWVSVTAAIGRTNPEIAARSGTAGGRFARRRPGGRAGARQRAGVADASGSSSCSTTTTSSTTPRCTGAWSASSTCARRSSRSC